MVINKRESTRFMNFNYIKSFIEYSNNMNDIYKNIDEYNPDEKQKILIMFDDMITDIFSNNKLNPTKTELFIKGRKQNISLVFITQSYFAVSRNIKLSSTCYFILQLNKLQLIIHLILNLETLWFFTKKMY